MRTENIVGKRVSGKYGNASRREFTEADFPTYDIGVFYNFGPEDWGVVIKQEGRRIWVAVEGSTTDIREMGRADVRVTARA